MLVMGIPICLLVVWKKRACFCNATIFYRLDIGITPRYPMLFTIFLWGQQPSPHT